MSESGKIAFYDGQCGLCHLAVVFLLKRDRSQSLFFAPIQSQAYRKFAQEHQITLTPRSIIVHDPIRNKLLTESDAVLHLLAGCGPGWWRTATFVSFLPKSFRNTVYRLVARFRHSFFRRPENLVPRLPAQLTSRILS